MSQDKPDRPLLIVGDAAEEVRDLLRHDCPDLLCAHDEATGLRLFAEREPALLVLAFQELERSERFYPLLQRQCRNIREIAHQTLLLCKSSESGAAFSLCRDHTFDDYLSLWPMHDPQRLRLAVHQARERQAERMRTATLSRRLAHIGSDLRHLDGFVGKALTDGQAHQAAALQACREFAGRLRQSRSEPDIRQVEGRLQEAQQWLQAFAAGYRERVAQALGHDFPPAQPEVMLVDDDDLYREMLGAMLAEAAVRVVHADRGAAALERMRQRRPDIVLLDYNMPGLDGMETLRRMKEDSELRQIPVIMLTGINARETINEVLMAGAAGFIVKPSNRPTILAKIRSVLPRIDN